ncbi:hypothetical protein [Pseudoalteromonas xiamenensis]
MSLSGVNWTPQLRELSVARMQELDLDVATHPDIARLVALSDFAHRILKSRPELVDWLEKPQQKDNREIPDPLPEDLDGLDDVTCSRLLRRYRQQYWLKVMWLDLVHDNAIEDSVRYVSLLAEKLIDSANRWAFNDVAKLNGMPMDEHGNRLPMLVLGMGKLGGQELNFSSDIESYFRFSSRG